MWATRSQAEERPSKQDASYAVERASTISSTAFRHGRCVASAAGGRYRKLWSISASCAPSSIARIAAVPVGPGPMFTFWNHRQGSPATQRDGSSTSSAAITG